MKFDRGFWISLLVFIAWMVGGWFIGIWLGIKTPAIWYLRAGWWLLGVAGFAGFLILRPKDQSAPLEGAAASAALEMDQNFAEASRRIQSATGIRQLNSLPAIFLIGDSGAAKTTILNQCGIEAELLAGQAMRDNTVVPTRSVNLWYGRKTLFIDPAGSMVVDPGARRKLFKKFLPVQLNSLLAARNPPTRSVLLTIDCDTVLQAGGANALAIKAREYQTILSELSRELGASFPVYVLFTKADKIPYFRDFVENLNEAEISEVFGVSLILVEGLEGAYAEHQSRRLNNAFQSVYHLLADKRVPFLAREHSATNLSNIYEFPREFAKLKPLLVPFLTDLCRPTQLGTSPFLRGFYFCGVRPVVINDVVPASQSPIADDAQFDANATNIFNRPQRSAPLAEARSAAARRIPQWVFLRTLFPGVLLNDRVGTAAAQVNVKVNLARRLLWASLAAVAIGMALWWTVSFSNNSRLVNDATDAARAVPAAGYASGQIASTDVLRRLSRLRETLGVLNEYERNGAPHSYGALLYKGNDIREPLRTTYYALFRRALLLPTQQTLVQIARNPGEAKEYLRYQLVYNALKTYLITTTNHDKRWDQFVGMLVQHWKKDQSLDSEREGLAASNFGFYAAELPGYNPYPQFATPDKDAVETARSFLNGFPLEDSIYRALLETAGDKLKPIIFNHDYPGTEETVRNTYRVEPWFTKAGYDRFQKQLQDPNAGLSREEWVLGPMTQRDIDMRKIRMDLKARYESDFVKTWREYLEATSEALPYGTYVRAAYVLDKLGGPQSALMQMFCVAAENTSVQNKEVADAFQPVQLITPSGCPRQLITSASKPYIEGLGNLSNALKAIGPVVNPNQLAVGQAQNAMSTALGTVTSLVTGFQSDPSDQKATVLTKTQSLLKDPIEKVQPTFGDIATAGINRPAGAMCAETNGLFRKYPFNAASREDASLQEVNKVLNPQSGQLWDFVRTTLGQQIHQSGSEYLSNPGVTPAIAPAFLAFLNRALHISQAIYHGDGTGNPSMSFIIQALPSQDVDHVSLSIDGVTLSGDPKNGPRQTFPWPGGTQDVSLQARLGGSSSDFSIVSATGPWAVWHALDRADRGANTLQWTPVVPGEGPVRVNGHPLTVKFSLDPQSAQILRPQYFSGLNCPGVAVH